MVPFIAPLPEAAAPTSRHCGSLAGLNRVIPQTSFSSALCFPRTCSSLAGDVCLARQRWCSHLHSLCYCICCSPEHLFLWLSCSISQEEMLGHSSSLCQLRTHTTHLAHSCPGVQSATPLPRPVCPSPLLHSLLPRARFQVCCLLGGGQERWL